MSTSLPLDASTGSHSYYLIPQITPSTLQSYTHTSNLHEITQLNITMNTEEQNNLDELHNYVPNLKKLTLAAGSFVSRYIFFSYSSILILIVYNYMKQLSTQQYYMYMYICILFSSIFL